MEFPVFIESILIDAHRMPFLEHHWNRIEKICSDFNLINASKKSDLEKIILSNYEIANFTKAKAKLIFKVADRTLGYDSINVVNYLPNNKEVRLIAFKKPKNSLNLFSNYKVESELLYSESIEYARAHHCDQSIIINEREEIVESSVCNIFLVKNGKTYTPPLSSGCVDGIMRSKMMQVEDIIEKPIPLGDIHCYEAIVLSNAVRGICKAAII
jgi:branched-subunit amino acid aminotransferase/4-amino-4-deoxychorismate lyase